MSLVLFDRRATKLTQRTRTKTKTRRLRLHISPPVPAHKQRADQQFSHTQAHGHKHDHLNLHAHSSLRGLGQKSKRVSPYLVGFFLRDLCRSLSVCLLAYLCICVCVCSVAVVICVFAGSSTTPAAAVVPRADRRDSQTAMVHNARSPFSATMLCSCLLRAKFNA